ncbi:MAG: hypothetical protein H7329_03250 [Opitutaceae bacterium]|nr:hypothetical protein [Cytophagales bacterium]
MADFQEDIFSKAEQFQQIINQYRFLLLSKQAMLAGYFVVIAVHVSTCYCLIAQGGFLSAITSIVMMINGLLGVIFFIWNRNYERRLIKTKDMGLKFGNEFLNNKESHLFRNLFDNQNSSPHKTASSILIIAVSLGSIGASVALFVLFTLPYINQHL